MANVFHRNLTIINSKPSLSAPKVIKVSRLQEPHAIVTSKQQQTKIGMFHTKVAPIKHPPSKDERLMSNNLRSHFPNTPSNNTIIKVNHKKWQTDDLQYPAEQKQTDFSMKRTDETKPYISSNNLGMPLPKTKKLAVLLEDPIYQSIGSYASQFRVDHDYKQKPKTNQKYCYGLLQYSRACIVWSTMFAVLLVIVDISVILVVSLIKSNGTTLTSTTSTTIGVTTATASPPVGTCSASSSGIIYNTLYIGNTSSTWTSITRNFTALSANSTLVMVIKASTNYGWFLDDFSVEDSSGNEMLTNGNFENGTLTNGWISTHCEDLYCANITNSGCSGGSGLCYDVTCDTVQALQQTFPTTPTNAYTFSFQIKWVGSNGSTNNNWLSYSIS
ncbi:unnamed protein product [Rotaria magnacalcarata]|uniref:Uncharacterized protein n=1 Tax=Rotaria magnacalcarata TaxID=392030 RepID=A0A819XKR3_9BILA|nr:unnamed protein product [Rotaria magnacalcarata]